MVYSKPSKIPRWNDTGSNRTEPLEAEKDAGWTVNDQPPSSYFNWLQYYTGFWVKWLDERLDKGANERSLVVRSLPPDVPGSGGDLDVTAADGYSSGAGGNLSIAAGDAVGSAKDGGSVTIQAGDADTSGLGGNISLLAGDGASGEGGDISLLAGAGVSAEGGDIILSAGDASNTHAGDLVLEGGSASGTNRASGTVTISTGDSTGSNWSQIDLLVSEAGASGAGVNSAANYLSLIGSAATKYLKANRFLKVDNTASGDTARGTIEIVPKSTDPTSPAQGDLFVHSGTDQLAVYNGTQYHNLNQVVYNMSPLLIYGVDPFGSAGPVTRVLNTKPFASPVTTTPLRHIIPANTLRVGSIIRVRALMLEDDIGGGTPYQSFRIYIGSIGAGPSPYESPTGLYLCSTVRDTKTWDNASVFGEGRIVTIGATGKIDITFHSIFETTGAPFPVETGWVLNQTIDTTVALDVFPAAVLPAGAGAYQIQCVQFVVEVI